MGKAAGTGRREIKSPQSPSAPGEEQKCELFASKGRRVRKHRICVESNRNAKESARQQEPVNNLWHFKIPAAACLLASCIQPASCQQIPVPSWRSNSRSETLSSLKGQQHHYSAYVATKMPASLPTASSAGLHAAACKQPRLGGEGGEGRNQHFAPHSAASHSSFPPD